uniref:Uncharacterized protein n=1 Tax=Glossina pallidipes TaxID=7398 RepID=A0A1B0A983_GLOPL
MIKLHQVRTPNRIAIQHSLAFINVSKHNGFCKFSTQPPPQHYRNHQMLATILAFGEYKQFEYVYRISFYLAYIVPPPSYIISCISYIASYTSYIESPVHLDYRMRLSHHATSYTVSYILNGIFLSFKNWHKKAQTKHKSAISSNSSLEVELSYSVPPINFNSKQ